MTVTAHISETEKHEDDLAMLIVGENKSGKSLLATTAPKPVLFFDFDKRAGALKGKKDIFALTFADPGDLNLQPTAFNELLGVLGQLEKTREIRVLHTAFKDVPAGLMVKTVVFDSIQTIANSARSYIMYGNDEISRKFAIAGRTYRVAKSYHAWGGEQAMVDGAIMQARAIVGLNVICILHEVPEKDERSTEDNPIYTGKIELYPVRYNSLLNYFNEVWRVTREVGKIPKVQVDPDGRFTKAATAFGLTSIEMGLDKLPDISAALQRVKR